MVGVIFGRMMWRALAAVALIAAAQAASAHVAEVGQPIATCVVRATPAMDPAVLLHQRGGFDCHTPQTDFGSGDFWVRSVPLALVDTLSPHEVRIASLWQRQVTLYALYGDGRIYRFVDDGRSASRHMQLGAVIQHQVPRGPVPLVRLLWHVEGSANLRGIVLGAHVSNSYQAGQANLMLGALYAGFIGLCIALLVYNLALWAALRYPFQPPYCAMVAGLLLYAISSSGALAWIFPDMLNNDRLRINYLLLAVSAAAAVGFARAFFEERIFSGWLRPASRIAMLGVLAPAVIFAIFAPMQIRLLDRLYAVTFIALVSIVAPILWRAWRMRSNFLWVFAIGWAAPIFVAVLRIMASLTLVPWSFWLDNSTIMSMTVEALVSSMAIAYRISMLSRERDAARIQEAAARLLADTDPLTGLLNRRAFLRDAIGTSGDQTLLLVDIDHFKRVNDTIGHDGGDEVLRVFARALRASVPASALIARIGGEEFAILLPGRDATKPDDILSHVRAERMPFDLFVTASIGMCSGPIDSDARWMQLYRTADRALFQAKAEGRDRARSGFAVAAAA